MGVYGFSELSCTKVYPKYLSFRHDVFNEQHRYHESGNPVFHFNTFDIDAEDGGHRQLPLGHPSEQAVGIEYDHYDIPKTLHLAYVDAPAADVPSDENATILGCLRLLPTDGNYMIRDNIAQGGWKDVKLLVNDLPNQNNVYEASRIAVAPYLSKGDPLRDTIVENLVYANVELGVRLGVRKMVGIMYHHIWQAVYCKRGVPVNYISGPFHIDDGQPVIIGEIDTSPEVLDKLNERYADKLAHQVIRPPQIEPNTWLMHYYHVNRRLPRPTMMEKRHMLAVGGN